MFAFNWAFKLSKHHFWDSVLKKHPSKFVGCCLANPADDGTGLQQLEHLVLEVVKKISFFFFHIWKIFYSMFFKTTAFSRMDIMQFASTHTCGLPDSWYIWLEILTSDIVNNSSAFLSLLRFVRSLIF